MTETTTLVVLGAAAAAAAAWGLGQLVLSASQPDRRKVEQRLSDDPTREQAAVCSSVIRRRPEELTGPLKQSPAMQRFGQRLQRVYPTATVGKFLALTG